LGNQIQGGNAGNEPIQEPKFSNPVVAKSVRGMGSKRAKDL
jgi:hypothetical protein